MTTQQPMYLMLARRPFRFALLLAIAASPGGAGAELRAQQSAAAVTLSEQIDRIFKAHDYDPPRFGPARWLPDGTAYAIIERAPGDAKGSDIVKYDAATGSRSVLVAASQLVP